MSPAERAAILLKEAGYIGACTSTLQRACSDGDTATAADFSRRIRLSCKRIERAIAETPATKLAAGDLTGAMIQSAVASAKKPRKNVGLGAPGKFSENGPNAIGNRIAARLNRRNDA